MTDIDIAARIRQVIRTQMHESARSLQSAARLIGPSEVGSCRAYLAHMIAGTPVDDTYDDIKYAAFIGTHLGGAIEDGLAKMFDDVQTQVPLTCTLPSGLQVSGNCDIVIAGHGIYDLKSKDKLAMVRRYPPSLQYLIQVNIYLAAAIQAGLVPEDGTWNLVYMDRSGAEDTPHVITGTLDPDILALADARLEDALYAAENNLDDAPRDMPMDFCLTYCPFVGSCRGKDEHLVEGLIDDPDHLAAIDAYQEGLRMQKEGERLKDAAKAELRGVSGSTGEYEVSWTWVDATEMKPYTRSGYNRMTVKRLPAKRVGA